MISCYADLRDNVFSFAPISEEGRSLLILTFQPSVPLQNVMKMIHTYLVTAGEIDMLIRIDINIG